ncbi:hypothetical protein Mp_6g20110 [Marchantia polymorpha subsp. ruderalis]|uniref:Uncharacterized protein n=2 Tax=Marchantia polymorpha TaxID=3197 RepID=A0AAF6BU21_MARPO|nr:hypothetical protein MARPO_0045s0053 [Marchantia polymorpha]BBN15505.1 hypothetical protein Mp_6g20110 [Marchantia polymorpha subsp. ruderalis]|eukprot:PTQ39384.1 hypothetical protein MARPO_0045s0053 [Marchantia polymorpha]
MHVSATAQLTCDTTSLKVNQLTNKNSLASTHHCPHAFNNQSPSRGPKIHVCSHSAPMTSSRQTGPSNPASRKPNQAYGDDDGDATPKTNPHRPLSDVG